VPPPKTLRQVSRDGAEIASELWREFALRFQEQSGTQPTPDPVLMTLFHSLAAQLAKIYREAEHVFPVAVFDELIGGLGLPPRLATPAQTVVAFSEVEVRETIGPETQIHGRAPTGERIPFAPDDVCQLSPARLAFAAVLEGGRLHTVPGATVGADAIPVTPGSVPVPTADSVPPTVYLAIESDEQHLSGLSLLLDLAPPSGEVAVALRRSPWCLLHEARITERTILRPKTGRGGVQRLMWLDAEEQEQATSEVSAALSLGRGPYGGQVWIFPQVQPDRRHHSAPPPLIAEAARLLLPEEHGDALDHPLAWIQIALPPGIRGVVGALSRVQVNCITASNIEVFNEQVTFDQMGSVISLRPEGLTDRYLMGVLSVTGEGGTRYVDAADVHSASPHGRYLYRAGQLEFWPAKQPNGRFDAYAMVRLMFCDGARGNGLEVGAIRWIDASLDNFAAQVSNVTVSRGGGAPPEFGDARRRFAEQLLTRGRIVTAGDIEAAAQAYEPRIREVEVAAQSAMTASGVQLVETVTVVVAPGDFADPESELLLLQDQLERHLQAQAVIGHHIRVEVRATERVKSR